MNDDCVVVPFDDLALRVLDVLFPPGTG